MKCEGVAQDELPDKQLKNRRYKLQSQKKLPTLSAGCLEELEKFVTSPHGEPIALTDHISVDAKLSSYVCWTICASR